MAQPVELYCSNFQKAVSAVHLCLQHLMRRPSSNNPKIKRQPKFETSPLCIIVKIDLENTSIPLRAQIYRLQNICNETEVGSNPGFFSCSVTTLTTSTPSTLYLKRKIIKGVLGITNGLHFFQVDRSFKLLLAFARTVITGFNLINIKGQNFCSLLAMYVFQNGASSSTEKGSVFLYR
jgi:hypothetical protein